MPAIFAPKALCAMFLRSMLSVLRSISTAKNRKPAPGYSNPEKVVRDKGGTPHAAKRDGHRVLAFRRGLRAPGMRQDLLARDVADAFSGGAKLDRRCNTRAHKLVQERIGLRRREPGEGPALGKRNFCAKCEVIDHMLVAGLEPSELLRRPDEKRRVDITIVELCHAVLEVGVIAPEMLGEFVEIVGRQGAVAVDRLEYQVVRVGMDKAPIAGLGGAPRKRRLRRSGRNS